jgi:hypothetical protein
LVKKLLLISDTHGHLHPEILALASRVDAVVHAGDVGGADVVASLQAASEVFHCVFGNNDTKAKWVPAGHRVLQGLPEAVTIELPGGALAVEHGHRANPAGRRHDILRRRHPDARLVVYGHSHRLVIDCDATPWVVNPGAAGRSRAFGGPSCVLVTIRGDDWELESLRFAW